jgi:SAM-dependent methyltransferase
MREYSLLDRDGLAVFDMGFGLGAMLFVFRPTCELAGLETSPSAVSQANMIANRRGYAGVDFRVFKPGVELPAEWRNHFDVVICSHVLEHIESPKPVLRELIALMKPGGYACIAVPINERPGDDLNHFHLFTESSFRHLLELDELEVLTMQSCDRLYRFMIPISRRRQRHSNLWLHMVSIAMNGLLAPLPHSILCLADQVLGWANVLPTQCFALVRRV